MWFTGDYDARYRVLLRHVAALLGIDWDEFEEVREVSSTNIHTLLGLGRRYSHQLSRQQLR